MKISPYNDVTMTACINFRSNFNFLFPECTLKGLFIYLLMFLVTIVIRLSTGKFVNQFCYHEIYPV